MSTHKALIAIVGPSGSGKSTSLRNLNPLTTIILDGERKGFPFKGSDKFTVLSFSNPSEFDTQFNKALALPNIELVVVESFSKYTEQVLTLCQKAYTGWDVWGNYAKMIRNRINNCKNDKVAVAFTCLDEIVKIPQTDGTETARRMIAIQGQELRRNGIEPEFLVVLFTDVNIDKGVISYRFETNNAGVTTAKTPMGMFNDRFVPNDLAEVLKTAKEYYVTT
jgi:hypothetical protein